MSTNECPVGSHSEDIWSQHRQALRHLYEVERKTCKQIKEIMEANHGFPNLPLSIYQRKLRYDLQLSKKFKTSDWPIINDHYQKRAAEGKKTALYLNDVLVGSKKVWKEIRRQGTRAAYKGQHSPRPLRDGITIRTPSPVPPTSSSVVSVALTGLVSPTTVSTTLISSGSFLTEERKKLLSSPDPLLALSCVGHLPGETCKEYAAWVHWLCLEGIPFRVFLNRFAGLVYFTSQRLRKSGNIHQQVSLPVLDLTLYEHLSNIAQRHFPLSSFLGNSGRLPSSPGIISDLSTYNFLIQVVYQLSNNLDMCKQAEVLDFISDNIPRSVFAEIFSMKTPTIRAAWERLVTLAGATDRKDLFSALMVMRHKHPEWMNPGCLSLAASMGCVDIVRDLLKSKTCKDEITRGGWDILEALAADSLECAKLLVDVADVNYCNTSLWHPCEQSAFQWFLYYIGARFTYRKGTSRIVQNRLTPPSVPVDIAFTLDNEIHNQGLQVLLDNGANVDAIWKEGHPLSELYTESYETDGYRITLVEMCFYWDEALFRRVIVYSTRSFTDITRHGICLAARCGKEAFHEYLQSKSSINVEERTKFLQLVLAEQFFLSRIDFQAVTGLIDFGVDILLPALKTDPWFLLGRLVNYAAKRGSSKDLEALTVLLLDKGVTVSANILTWAVAQQGLSLLPILVPYALHNIAESGATALAIASRFDNFEAVEWLLHYGVDINAAVTTDCRTTNGLSILAFALDHHSQRHFYQRYKPSLVIDSNPISFKMLGYLITKGAKSRFRPQDQDSLQFLEFAIRNHPISRPFSEILDLILDSGANLRNASGSLLEACLDGRIGLQAIEEIPHHGLALFESLYRRGAPLRPGSPLATLIYRRGKRELIRELLDDGADINAYCHDTFSEGQLTPLQAAASKGDQELVYDLLQKGGDINAVARGRGGTALQAACRFDALSTEEKISKAHLIRFLLEEGAEVNAVPIGTSSDTALQIAALRGDLETTHLLLNYNADVNLRYPDSKRRSALDYAALTGRLDVVKLLLNENALSHDTGSSGYEGAIRYAEQHRYFAVADLIRQRVAENLETTS